MRAYLSVRVLKNPVLLSLFIILIAHLINFCSDQSGFSLPSVIPCCIAIKKARRLAFFAKRRAYCRVGFGLLYLLFAQKLE